MAHGAALSESLYVESSLEAPAMLVGVSDVSSGTGCSNSYCIVLPQSCQGRLAPAARQELMQAVALHLVQAFSL
jgi:hypothetical protein